MKTHLISVLSLMAVTAMAQSSLKLVVPIGHTRPITALAATTDDRLILSGGADNLIHQWSVDGGRLLKTYRGHAGAVSSIIISASGKYFVSLDNTNLGFVRELASGAILDSVKISNGTQVKAASSVDVFAWIDDKKKLRVWSLGKIKTLQPKRIFYALAIAPNGKSLLGMSAQENANEYYWWGPSQMESLDVELINIQGDQSKIICKAGVASGNQLDFTPDSKLALVGDDGNAVFAYAVQSQQRVAKATQGIWLDNFTVAKNGLVKLNCYDGIRLWDPAKNIYLPFSTESYVDLDISLQPLGAVFNQQALDSLHLKEWYASSYAQPLPWQPELYALSVEHWGTDKGSIEQYSRKARYAYWRKGSARPTVFQATIAMKLHTKNWMVSSVDKTIVITDLEANKKIKELHGVPANAPNQLVFSPDNKSLIYRDKWLRQWNFSRGKLNTTALDSQAIFTTVSLVGKPPLLLVGGTGKIEFRQQETNQLAFEIRSTAAFPFGRVTSLSVSGDAKFLMWSDEENKTYLRKINWSYLDWYEPKELGGNAKLYRTESRDDKTTLTFEIPASGINFFLPNQPEICKAVRFEYSSSNEIYLLKEPVENRLKYQPIELWVTYVERKETDFSFKPVKSVSYSQDGNRILITDQSWRGTPELRLVDLSPAGYYPGDSTSLSQYDGYEYMTTRGWYRSAYVDLNFIPTVGVLHPTEPWIAAGNGNNNSIYLKPLRAGDTKESFSGHNDVITSMAFSPDGKLLASGSMDNTVKIWSTQTRQEVATLSTFGKDEWVVSHPSGLFDASPGAMAFLYFSTGNETIGLEQLKDRFYEPGLLKKIIAGETLRAVSGLDRIDLYPDISSTLDTLNAKLTITLTDRGGGIGKTSMLINAKEAVEDVRTLAPANTQSKGALSVTIDLSTYKNLSWGALNFIGVKAFNASGYIASPMHKIFYSAPDKQKHIQAFEPSLYCLVVGVSDYQNDELDLKYSAKDAQDFSVAVTAAGKRLFGNRVNVTLLTSNTAEESRKPTKKNITSMMNEISSKAQQQDLVMLYFSGHGTNLSGDEADFLYLTADARSFAFNDPVVRQSTTLSSTEITEFMKTIAAQKQVIIFDACASGRVVENLLAKRDVPSSTLRAMERMKDRTGTYILTGCAADAVSYEASQFGQGLLTYSLLSGMKGAALRENKFVDVLKLFQYAKDEVPRLAENVGGIQEPKVFSPYGGESFDIGFLEDSDKQNIPLTEAKPFFVRTAFQNEVRLRDDIGLGKAMDQVLAEQSHTGKSAPLVFIDANEFPGAFYLSGRYKIENGSTILKLVIFKNDKQIGSFDKTLSTTEIAKIQNEIMAFALATLKQKIQ